MTAAQLPIAFTGKELKEKGMEQAEKHANQVHEGWSEKAFQFLRDFASTTKKEFLIEDVREASKGCVPEPPTARAWGRVVQRAAFAGFIIKAGYRNVKNAKAHATPATLWRPC